MSSYVETVKLLLVRELSSFKREIEAFPNEADIWAAPPGISNSAGNLALHCAGNLQHFIAAKLGASGYVRDRDSEFSRRNVPRVELLAEIDRAIAAVEATLTKITDADLPTAFPEKLANKLVAADVFLLHLAVHLAYHLGQADYHRRMTTGDATTVNTVAVADLPPAAV